MIGIIMVIFFVSFWAMYLGNVEDVPTWSGMVIGACSTVLAILFDRRADIYEHREKHDAITKAFGEAVIHFNGQGHHHMMITGRNQFDRLEIEVMEITKDSPIKTVVSVSGKGRTEQ
jgi:hypothetical protein